MPTSCLSHRRRGPVVGVIPVSGIRIGLLYDRTCHHCKDLMAIQASALEGGITVSGPPNSRMMRLRGPGSASLYWYMP